MANDSSNIIEYKGNKAKGAETQEEIDELIKKVPACIRKCLDSKYDNKSLSDVPKEDIDKAYAEMLNGLDEEFVRGVGGKDALTSIMKDRMMNTMFLTSGSGGYFNTFQTFYSCLDRYNLNHVPRNTEYSGYTFITRPRLCLQSSNLRTNRRMMSLDTTNINSVAFMIRALLDSRLSSPIDKVYYDLCAKSSLFDVQNPFMVPLCNSLMSISGWPDMNIQTETTQGGYNCEAQTFAIGSDDFNRATTNLNAEFKDVQNGPISAIFYFWLEYIRCVTRGIMVAYPDDIDEQRLNYTVSIYRFVVDPTQQYIVDWSKCTGCFPTTLNIGSMIQVNDNDTLVNCDRISTSFTCNKIEYRDYAIFMDFNALMRRYCPSINLTKDKKEHSPNEYGEATGELQCPTLPILPITNFRGLPWITSDRIGPKIVFREVSNPAFDKTSDDNFSDYPLIQYLTMMELKSKVAMFPKSIYSNYAKHNTYDYHERMESGNNQSILDDKDLLNSFMDKLSGKNRSNSDSKNYNTF